MAPIPLLCSLTFSIVFFARGMFSQHERPTAISSSLNATCPARTVNYITHTLPQLCLASSRPIPIDTTSTEAGRSYLFDSTTNSSAIPQANTISEESSPTLTSSITAASSRAPLLQSPESPSRSAAEPETKLDDADLDSESDLGNAKFLSFEDWKRQNLARSGQSEHIGASRLSDVDEPRRKPVPVSDTLDSLGDDGEIDLDFAGFAAERPDVAPPGQSARNEPDGEDKDKEEVTAPVRSKPRSKDAGTTCKERFNYASFDCAATVLKTNPEAKGSSSVLSENKDSYMLNECSADNKFLILELCNDISIDTIVLANFEFFSSIFRTFRVSVSDRYPVKVEKWRTLGTFEARNSRDVQAFLVENPMIWARYLRIEFLTHYGSEYYCPVSLIRVHGTTMMEDYKHDLDASRADDEEVGSGSPRDDVESFVPEAVADVLVQEEGARSQAVSQDNTSKNLTDGQPSSSAEQVPNSQSPSSARTDVDLSPYNKTDREIREMAAAFNTSQLTCPSPEYPNVQLVRNATGHTSKYGQTTCTDSPLIEEDMVTDELPLETSNTSFSTASDPPAPVTDPVINSALVNMADPKAEISPSNSHSAATKTANATHGEHTRTAASSPQPPPASPTIQESFFKSVQKRLQMLESNSSLSLQYIEEQSRNLRDAFGRVEQRQMSKTTAFLDYLNSTVLSELRDFRQQYDQLWQSTVIELDTQREQYQKEVLAINSRLAMLADEVIFQKRMSVLQSVLVLICLGLVLFSRGAMHNYLELPIVQNMLARSSPSLRRLNAQILQSPAESPATTRPSSSHKQDPLYGVLKPHQSQVSEDSAARPPSPTTIYSPPTPTSFDGGSDVDEVKEPTKVDSPAPHYEAIMRPNSSPPMLTCEEDT